MSLPKGLYDRLIYEDEIDEVERLLGQQRAIVVAPSVNQRREQLVAEMIQRLPDLLDVAASHHSEESEKARAEIELIRQLLIRMRPGTQTERLPASPAKLLKSIHDPDAEVALPLSGVRHPCLFTSAKADPSLLAELRAELRSANRVDILVSFITWSGVRKLLDIFQQITALDAVGQPKTKLRILTTTYIGATEVRAVDALARLPGAELRISLDGRRTRLHAKAWIFQRDTAFGTAFVGSANLSESALIGGIEWTIKFTQAIDTSLFAAAQANFETLWNDQEFQPYDPTNESHRIALTSSLSSERGHSSQQSSPTGSVIALQTWFDLRPKSYQQEMLDQLASERRLGRRRNLLVAATGTGKTVVAAFDYLRLRNEEGSAPKLLFIAHQTQILVQALTTFRQVLRDPSFGELLDGQNTPLSYEHIFATIQTVHRRNLVEQLGNHFWRMVIVDEAHHLPANTFHQFMNAVEPHYLLGLTATPERSDGQSLMTYFDKRPDGSPAVSLRLWDALNQQLLAPFEYYATADGTDLRGVDWGRGAEISQLSNVVTGNSVRASLVVHAIERYVSDLNELKCLAFCVNVSHANFMAEFLCNAGLPAVALSGEDSQAKRLSAVQSLTRGDLKVICSCDIFNEGIDIPDVNTILLLRPTQSPVVFQQQIGRGLRLAQGKDACLVLDFIGVYNNDFRFDVLLRSITGQSRRKMVDEVKNGFSSLPPGTHIQFDRVARERVLGSLQQTLILNVNRLCAELAAWAALQNRSSLLLKNFLLDNQLELQDVYNGGTNSRSWTSLKRRLDLVTSVVGEQEPDLLRRIFSLLHANDPKLLSAWEAALDAEAVDERRVQMMAYQLITKRENLISPQSFLELIRANPEVQSELKEIVSILKERTSLEARPLLNAPNDWVLSLHGRYSRSEILSAVGFQTPSVRPLSDSGCLSLTDEKIEILFVTLDKSQGFDECVQYQDFAVAPDLFHWQTQNRARPSNASGKRYTESPTNGWSFQLFVRENRESAYVALGPVELVSHSGEAPISINWRLLSPLTAELFRKFSVLRG